MLHPFRPALLPPPGLLGCCGGCCGGRVGLRPAFGTDLPVKCRHGERYRALRWDQVVSNGVDLASYQFVSYVDGAAHALSDAACQGNTPQVACSASLPPMSAGAHVLTLTTVLQSNG